jgi:hypothetical protein
MGKREGPWVPYVQPTLKGTLGSGNWGAPLVDGGRIAAEGIQVSWAIWRTWSPRFSAATHPTPKAIQLHSVHEELL